jgi:chromosome segregation ATPase
VSSAFWTTIGSLGLSTIVTAIVAYLGTSKTLRRNQPVTDATAQEKTALTNKANVETARGLIADLRSELDRQVAKADRMEKRMNDLEAKLDAAEEQADLAGAQLVEAQEEIRQLRRQNRELTEVKRLLQEQVTAANRLD